MLNGAAWKLRGHCGQTCIDQAFPRPPWLLCPLISDQFIFINTTLLLHPENVAQDGCKACVRHGKHVWNLCICTRQTMVHAPYLNHTPCLHSPQTFCGTYHDISEHGCILRTWPRTDLRHVCGMGSTLGTYAFAQGNPWSMLSSSPYTLPPSPQTFCGTCHNISQHECILRTWPRTDLRHVCGVGSTLGTYAFAKGNPWSMPPSSPNTLPPFRPKLLWYLP